MDSISGLEKEEQNHGAHQHANQHQNAAELSIFIRLIERLLRIFRIFSSRPALVVELLRVYQTTTYSPGELFAFFIQS